MSGSVKLEKCCVKNFRTKQVQGVYIDKKTALYYLQLRALALQLQTLQSTRHKTQNPYRRLAQKVALPGHLPADKILALFDGLVHGLTVLNRMYRVRRKAAYLSSREDVLNVLMLMRPLVFPESVLNENTRKAYLLLEDYFDQGQSFTGLEARLKLRVSRSSLNRYLRDLQLSGLVRKVGGNCKQGYRYALTEQKMKGYGGLV